MIWRYDKMIEVGDNNCLLHKVSQLQPDCNPTKNNVPLLIELCVWIDTIQIANNDWQGYYLLLIQSDNDLENNHAYTNDRIQALVDRLFPFVPHST